jgi:hypothetical protein
MLGVKISPVGELEDRVLAPVLLKVLRSGTVVADGSEQTLLEYAGAVAAIGGYVDLGNMEEGDAVVVRVYVKVRADGEYRLYHSERLEGRQEAPALYILPRVSGFAYKATLQQVAGAYKSFDYLFVKGA